jgi:hypothetical protein
VDEILDCLSFSDRLCWKVHMESPLDAENQFGAGKAVNSEIALYAAGRLDLHEAAALGMQFTDEIAHQHNQVAAVKLGIA